MIHAFGRPDPPVPRLLASLAERGHRVGGPSEGASDDRATLVLAAGTGADPLALGPLFDRWRRARGGRVMVMSSLGAHPDAKTRRLRELWRLEEGARNAGLPLLVLRLAPLVGPRSPLWLRLRARPRLPGGGRQLLNPVAEADVVDTIEKAVLGNVEWRGWYELAGPEVVSLAEMVELAAISGPRLPTHAGAWEPPMSELLEHRLAEANHWLVHFGLSPRPLTACVEPGVQ